MHKKLAALFTEHAKPKHASCANVQRDTAPVHDLVSRIERQLSEYRSLLAQAELEPDIPDELQQKFEFLHQTLRAADREIAACLEAQRKLVLIAKQLDRVMVSAKGEIEEYYARPHDPALPT